VVLPGHCPNGRTNTRIMGWMGRADQTTKVYVVHPAQVAEIARRFPVITSTAGGHAKWQTTA
jgi:phenylacetate-CoA ligase